MLVVVTCWCKVGGLIGARLCTEKKCEVAKTRKSNDARIHLLSGIVSDQENKEFCFCFRGSLNAGPVVLTFRVWGHVQVQARPL